VASSDQRIHALDRIWLIPAVPARAWLDAVRLDEDGLVGVFPGLIDIDEADFMLDAFLDCEDAEARCLRAARSALQRETRMEWVVAWNLMKICNQMWLWINGVLLRQNVNADLLPLGDWLHAAYTVIYEGKDERGRIAFESELMAGPRGEHLVVSAQAQRKAAMAFAAD
jgi:hypothetical protein